MYSLTRVFVAMAAALPLFASAANLIENADFDGGLDSWVVTEPSTILRLESNEGWPLPPAMDVGAPGVPGQVHSACFSFTPKNFDFHVAARLMPPSSYALAYVIFFSQPDCVPSSYTSLNLLNWSSSEDAGWIQKSIEDAPTPVDARSAFVLLSSDDRGHVLFDNIRFGPSGSAPVELQSFVVN